MKQVVEFLTLLHENNDKAWFDSHKEMYKRALSCFEVFTAKLIDGWTVLRAEVYIELSCGIRCREGVKEYEEKMCGNDVNRNNDRIFSWLWKQQRRKR